ncbi:MAG: CHAT domain-containing tetratricopeptide repeat protein [bacterium]
MTIRYAGALLLVVLATSVGAQSAADCPWREWRTAGDSLAESQQYDSAVGLYESALACLGSSHGSLGDDTVRASILSDMGQVYLRRNQYAVADSLWKISLEMLTADLDDSHDLVLNGLNWLGHVTIYMADYARAEGYLMRALAGWENSAKDDTAYVLKTQLRLGVICMNQERVADAEQAYTAALELIADDPARYPRLSAALRNNLSNMYRWQGRHDEAEPLLLAQIQQIEAMEEPYVDILLATYHTLAETYSDLERWDEAEKYFGIAVERTRELAGDDYSSIAFTMTSLGNLYLRQKRFADAAEQYAEALRIKRRMVGLADRSVANTLVMYSQCQQAQGNLTQALELAAEAFSIRHADYRRNSWVLTEDRALTFSDIMRNTANTYLGPLLAGGEWNEQILSQAADIILAAKGQVSDGIFERRRALALETDENISTKLSAYRGASESLSRLFRQGPGQGDPEAYQHTVDSVGRHVRDLEANLVMSSRRFGELQAETEVSLRKVVEMLPASSSLVEYYRYRYVDLVQDITNDGYLALVILPQAPVRLIDLGPAAKIDSLVAAYRDLIGQVGRTWPGISDEAERAGRQAAKTLFDKLLAPTGVDLSQTGLLLIAPDGALSLLSFATLMDEQNRYVIEQVPIHYLSAGRDLLRLQPTDRLGHGLLAFGDVDYDAGLPDQFLASGVEPDQVKQDSKNTTRRAADWPLLARLPYTGREVRQVTRAWRHDTDTTVLLGAAANEMNFKKLCAGRRVIHVATHGFFEPAAEPSPDQESDGIDNPLLRSGLYLAGANLLEQDLDSEGEDGHLTAWEVTALDLTGTEWVVLSACESGLGKVQTGEGVYGLRRAFQMAGAATVISSLWPVADKQTASIMKRLYSSDDPNLACRLRAICLAEIGSLREKGLSDHPYPWGAFTAQGAWQMR